MAMFLQGYFKMLKFCVFFTLLYSTVTYGQIRCEFLHQPAPRLQDLTSLATLVNHSPKSWYQNHLGGPVFGQWRLIFKNDQQRIRWVLENFDLSQIRTTEELNAVVRGLSELSFGNPRSMDYWLKNSTQARWQQELLILKNKSELSEYLIRFYGPLDSAKVPGRIKKTSQLIINLFMLPVRLWPANMQDSFLTGKAMTEGWELNPQVRQSLKKYDHKQAYEYFRQNMWSRVVIAGLVLQSILDHFDHKIEQLQEQAVALEELGQAGQQIVQQYQDQVKMQFVELMIKAMSIYNKEQNLFPELRDPEIKHKLITPEDIAKESPALSQLRHCVICAHVHHLTPKEVEPGRFEARFNFCPVPPVGLCSSTQ